MLSKPGTVYSQPVEINSDLTPWRNLDLGLTGQVALAKAGRIGAWTLCNQASSKRYVKFYDKATAPTEADTPVFTIVLQANQTLSEAFADGIGFASGISLRGTNVLADNDTTAPTTNDIVVSLGVR